MKFSIHFNKAFLYFRQADEIIIKYSKPEEHLKDYAGTLDPRQTLVLDLTQYEGDLPAQFDDILDAKEIHDKICFLLSEAQEEWIPALKDYDYYFVDKAKDYQDIDRFITYGARDVIITGDLLFDLPNVHKYCKYNGIKVRVIPNLVTNAHPDNPISPDYYIRPEDLWDMRDWIDCVEFAGEYWVENAAFHIYSTDLCYWNDFLSPFIVGITKDNEKHSCMYDPEYGLNRATCKLACLNGDRCRYCDQIETIGKYMLLNNMAFEKPKDTIHLQKRMNYKGYIDYWKGNEDGERDNKDAGLADDVRQRLDEVLGRRAEREVPVREDTEE